MNANELKEILDQHKLWLADKSTGRRADLSYADLRFAGLRGCDLRHASLRGANLRYAKLRGCDLRFAKLRGCDLRDAGLSGCGLRGCDLRGCDLRFANLSGADLSGADLCGADLRVANLSGADLSGTHLPTVTPYPQLVEKIAEQVDAREGCLDMRNWHTCDTVHCLAGWAVTLHEDGKKLEDEIGTSAAAALIFNASCGEVPDFHSDDQTAMAWLKSKVNQRGQA